MQALQAFQFLDSKERFTEGEAQELAHAFARAWDGGPQAWQMVSGERTYTRATLERWFRDSIRCRPCGDFQTR